VGRRLAALPAVAAISRPDVDRGLFRAPLVLRLFRLPRPLPRHQHQSKRSSQFKSQY